MIDSLDTVFHQRLDFVRRNGATAAAEDSNVARTKISQLVNHVAKKFVVPALVGTDRDAVRVLLDSGPYDIFDAAVMAEMNNLGTLRLDQAPHYVNSSIMAVEKRCRSNKSQRPNARLARDAWQITGCSVHC